MNIKPNIILLIIGISAVPFLWLLTQIEYLGSFWYALANISGLLAGLFFFWQILLGIRGIAIKISKSFGPILNIHMLLGIYSFVFVLLHSILEIFIYSKAWTYLFIPESFTQWENDITLGRIGLILFILVWLSSTFIRNKMSYKAWRYVHYLSYVMAFLVIIHAVNLGSFINGYPFIAGYWYLIAAGLVLVVIYRLYQVVNSYVLKAGKG